MLRIILTIKENKQFFKRKCFNSYIRLVLKNKVFVLCQIFQILMQD